MPSDLRRDRWAGRCGSRCGELAEHLVAQAGERGIALTGPGGLLSGLTKQVLQTALEAELTEYLGHQYGEPRGPGGNVRNGRSAKTLRTRDRGCADPGPSGPARSFEPVLVPVDQASMLAG
jgi:transposase-like protein